MKRLIIVLIIFSSTIGATFGQVPNSFRYQAVIRNASGDLVANKLVGFEISILGGSAVGQVVYAETFEHASNEFGIVSLNIGSGTNISGDFSQIDWSANTYYLQVEIDIDGGDNYQFMGTSQILAVPYALQALNVTNKDDADADPNNEMQTISKNGNTVTLSNSGGSFTDDVNDADADPDNEIQDLVLTGNTLTITNKINPNPIDLSAYQGTNSDEQQLSYSFINNILDLTIGGGTGGNTINIPLVRADGGTFTGSISATNLSGINTGDMTNIDVVNAYQLGYTNYFNSADHTKLNGIEPNARADMTNGEIVSAYQSGYPNYFNSSDHTKLDFITLINGFEVSGGGSVEFSSAVNTLLALPNGGTLANQTYVNNQISNNALSQTLTNGAILIGNNTNDATPRTISGDAQISNTGVLSFTDIGTSGTYRQVTTDNKGRVITGTNPTTLNGYGITDAISTALNSGRILIGNGSNFATDVIMSGDATITNTGVLTVSRIGGNAISIGGDITFDDAFDIIINSTANTTITLPTAGTLATTADITNNNSSYTGSTSIVTVGTIGTGIWNAGAVTSSGTITGTSIIRNGGTSSQFLKADGSVDANTYLTSFTELDPVYASSPASGITALNITNWNTAFGWGDHSAAGYLTSYTETDPIFVAHAANGITASNITNWNTAFGWGDHSGAGYLTSYTETDPIFVAHAANGITATNITNWTTAFGWGDHSGAGYLTSYTETDPIYSGDPASSITALNITNWTTAHGWGDHSAEGYLTSYTETDPIYSGDPASGITALNITNWTTAHGWGDHSAEGYLTSYTETDPIYSGDPASGITALNITNWTTAHGWGDHSIEGYLTSLSSPGQIGITTPNTGAFTTLSASGTATFSGAVNINDILHLTPVSTPPSTNNGDIYIDSDDNHIYCRLNGIWVQLDN